MRALAWAIAGVSSMLVLSAALSEERQNGVLMPPPEYDYMPDPAPITVYVEDANTTCIERGIYTPPDKVNVGCSSVAADQSMCVIWVARTPPYGIPLEVVLRHEYAHCNGWVHQ